MTRPVSKQINKVKDLASQAPMSLHSKAILTEPLQHDTEGKQAVDAGPGAVAYPDAAGHPCEVQSPASSPLSGVSSGVAIVDWDEMFSAVKERLRRTVTGPMETLTEAQAHDAAGRVRSSVLECVEALEQLQATMRAAIERCRQLEMPARKA